MEEETIAVHQAQASAAGDASNLGLIIRLDDMIRV